MSEPTTTRRWTIDRIAVSLIAVDRVGLIGSLVMVPALAALALWAGRQDR